MWLLRGLLQPFVTTRAALLFCNVGNVYWDVYNSDNIVDSCGMFALSFLPLFSSPRSGIQKNLSLLKMGSSGVCFYYLLVFKLTFQKSQFLATYLEDSPLPSLADIALHKGSHWLSKLFRYFMPGMEASRQTRAIRIKGAFSERTLWSKYKESCSKGKKDQPSRRRLGRPSGWTLTSHWQEPSPALSVQ